jgi:hypothetical protein
VQPGESSSTYLMGVIEAAILMFRLNIEMKLQEGVDIAGLNDSQDQT